MPRWGRQAGIAVLAGALGAALAAASLALGGASFNAASTVTLCVNANDGVNYRSSGCIAGETALPVGAPVPAATASNLTAIGAADPATLQGLQTKLKSLTRNPKAQSMDKQLARMFQTLVTIMANQHQKSNSMIENLRG